MATSLVHHISIKEVFITSWILFRRYYKEVVILALVLVVLEIVFQNLLPFVPLMLRSVFNSVLFASILYIPQAFILFLIDKKEHRQQISFSQAIKQFSSLIIPVFLITLAFNSIVVLGSALLLLPGIIAMVLLGQAPLFVLLQKTPLKNSFAKSIALMKGNRMNYIKIWFFFLLFGYLPIAMVIIRFLPQIAPYFLSFFISLYVTVIYAIWVALQRANPTK